jgi:hypothetical protein
MFHSHLGRPCASLVSGPVLKSAMDFVMSRSCLVIRMNVFLSWSGERSWAVATAPRDWLPDVLHRTRTWMSENDIWRDSCSWNCLWLW